MPYLVNVVNAISVRDFAAVGSFPYYDMLHPTINDPPLFGISGDELHVALPRYDFFSIIP